MKKLLLLAISLVCTLTLMAQERTITGVVMDGELKGEPLIGATVSYGEGKIGQGTITDYNGRFTLKVPADVDKLTISYVGYESKVIKLTAATSDYSVQLPADAKSLSEVVVTGYQKIDRRKLTAAVSKLDISEETVGAVKNIDQALAGQIAGLSATSANGGPGAPVKIRIRGTSTINGVAEPLWVLDGIPLEGNDIPAVNELKDIDDIYQTSIAGINPSDIDNITVLKDAAATAIYGARAANGVIVITTKKGKEGRPAISFSTKLTYSPKTSIDRLNLMNADQKVGLELDLIRTYNNEFSHKGGVAGILDALGEYNTYKTNGWDALSATAQERINGLRGINTDWNDILLRSAFNHEHNASISGGSERMKYYAALGYYDEKGNVKGVENNRYNITLKLSDIKINSRLTLGFSVFANQRKQESFMTDTDGFTNPLYYARIANPYQRPFEDNGDFIYDYNVQNRSEAPEFNIFEERSNTSKERTDRSVLALLNAELKILKGLKLTTQFGYQYDNYTLERYAGQNSYAMRKMKKNNENPLTNKTILPDGGMIRKTDSHSNQWTWKAMLEWNKRFNEIHDVELMAGTEVRHTETKGVTSTAYGYDPRTLTTQPILFPDDDRAISFYKSNPLYQEVHTENAYVSWFATGSYTLLHRYTLGGSVRWDGSDVFGVSKSNRYLPLYSVSGLWRIKEEPFMGKVNWLSDLSVRLSYGIQGNIDKNTSPYLLGVIRRKNIIPGYPEDMIDTNTAPNPDLKWEKTKNLNAGVDIAFLKNRIRLSVDYYYRKSTDLIGYKSLALETGFAQTTMNWASMENKGWEISLGTSNIKTKDFSWTTTLNLGFNTNKVIQETLREGSTEPSREGYPVNSVFAFKTAGLDEYGYPLFVAKDGSVKTAAEFFKLNRAGKVGLSAEEERELYTYMGSTDPDCSGGFINNFEYKDWTLGINFIFNYGAKVQIQPSYNPVYYHMGKNSSTEILNRWTPTNTNTNLPALMSNIPERSSDYQFYASYGQMYNRLDTWVKDCNYWRLQSLRLGYKLPKEWLKKIGISSASVSLEGRNLLVFASDYDNYLDPETMGNPYAQPIAKSIIFGINLNF